MLIRRSHEQPVKIPTAAGGKRMATRTMMMSDDLTIVKTACTVMAVSHCPAAERRAQPMRAPGLRSDPTPAEVPPTRGFDTNGRQHLLQPTPVPGLPHLARGARAEAPTPASGVMPGLGAGGDSKGFDPRPAACVRTL